uniref:Peptidase S59 domain-containing protein n=1 Tax=Echinostoma caproni TaxID=27848 RepID=A0A183ARR2_9TREM
LFGTPTASLGASPGQTNTFAFGNSLKPAGTTNLFGTATVTTANALKPGGLFGTPASSGTTFGFGAGLTNTQTPAFGGFGTGTASSAGGLFGQNTTNSLTAKKTFGFGTGFTNTTVSSAATPGVFGFGQGTQAGGLFGGATGATVSSTAPTFGLGATPTGTGSSLFGTGTTGFGIGQKPATLGGSGGFGLGTTGFGLGSGTAGLGGAGTGLSKLDLSSSFVIALCLGVYRSQQQQLGTLGGSVAGLNANASEQMAQAVRAQQQVLELVRSMPYGQSPLFRYLNTSSASSDGVAGADENKDGTTSATGPGGTAVAPAKLLFSGFYEDDALLSPAGPTGASGMRVRRSATVNADGSGLDTSILGTKPPGNGTGAVIGGFFVRRDEWKRLHLPENIRASILERSASSAKEMSTLAEAAIDTDRHPLSEDDSANRGTGRNWGSGDLSSPVVVRTEKPGPERLPPNPISTKSLVPAAVSTPGTPRIGGLKDANQTPAIRIMASGRSGLGLAQAREALKTGSRDDSVLLEDLDSTWTSPNGQRDATLPMGGSDTTPNDCRSHGVSSHALDDRSKTSPPKSPNSIGIKLTKPGYYTLPTLEELASMVDEKGGCIVEDFVIGRRHYGHILFPGLTDLTGIDLDAIVHIRRREVVVYPDDEKKPTVGLGLNKRAEVCLESIWPTDKATHEPIKSLERLAVMRFEERLERATRRMDARFIEYRPESGSWVFEVKHFSKYGLQDSDEEDAPSESGHAAIANNQAAGTLTAGGHPLESDILTSSAHLRTSLLVTKRSSEQRDEPRESEKTEPAISDRHLWAPFTTSKLDPSINFLSPVTTFATSASHTPEACLSLHGDETTRDYGRREQSTVALFGGTQSLSVPTNVVRQMRHAFFSPARSGSRSRRSGLRFGMQPDGDDEEIVEDVDQQDDHVKQNGTDRDVENWPQIRYDLKQSGCGGSKRFPPSPASMYEEEINGQKFGVPRPVGGLDSKPDEKSFFIRYSTDLAAVTTLWTSGMRFLFHSLFIPDL